MSARPPLAARPVRVWTAATGALSPIARELAAEVPVALTYNGTDHAVLMASPANLLDFATGFTLAEGIVATVQEIRACQLAAEGPGYVARITIPPERASALAERRRAPGAASPSCGLCGTESVAAILRPLPPLPAPVQRLSLARLHGALADLDRLQHLHRATGGVHAAAFLPPGEGPLGPLREDIGRHTALDKLIGALARAGQPAADGAVLMSSRCSLDLVQKCVTAGIGTLMTIGVASGLAAEIAAEAGLTLLALARRDSMLVITDPMERLT